MYPPVTALAIIVCASGASAVVLTVIIIVPVVGPSSISIVPPLEKVKLDAVNPVGFLSKAARKYTAVVVLVYSLTLTVDPVLVERRILISVAGGSSAVKEPTVMIAALVLPHWSVILPAASRTS